MSIGSSDLEAFKEEPTPKANKIHWELALPTVKSPPDLTIDNKPRTSDKAIAEILIAGFTGQLKGWWDHLLTMQQQLDILNAIQIDENGAPILDEFTNPIQDAVATLILTISLHFIGDPSHLRDKNAELLYNLRCRKLSEFQDYKTTFFTRLFLRDDANHTTWKEKFLAGLPTLLGEKVRNSIKALYDNRIPYDELTYGELKRLKWELRKSKQELGSFCKQFNYDPFKTSISKNFSGECSSKPHKRHYKSKSYRKPFQKFRESSYKKPQRPYKKPNFSKKKEFKPKHKAPFKYKEAICHKCGIKGHTAKYCRMNQKLHELGLDEEILSKVAPLLIESSDSESSMSGDSDPLQVDELIDSDTSAYSSSDFETDSYLKKINVLTKDQETFLELIMPPKRSSKGKGIAKDIDLKATSKESQSSPPKEKLLSSAMPIKSWIDMIEDEEAKSKALSTHDQVNQWMKSISKSPELMLALQSFSQTRNLQKRSLKKKARRKTKETEI
ncbi:uncharacterized protein LOC107176445 [Citrus sinensis]|uniref:uncharacterized protein LOC107176445 n=1 Tax=Citrus sinensis TaxID=2711 RepID=UPI0022776DEC|nr:uncharacterized protein LOC107176445 [Citrus sinensis]